MKYSVPHPRWDQTNSVWGRQLSELVRTPMGLSVYIETGTMHGANAAYAAEVYDQVYSIDINRRYTQDADRRWGYDRPNLHFLHGHSPQVLPGLLANLPGPAVFWLDAHCSKPQTLPSGEYECPVLEEIRLVTTHRADHLILIDDARLFLAPPPVPHRIDHWPSLFRVLQALQADHADTFFIACLADIVVRCPVRYKGLFEEFWRQNYRNPNYLPTSADDHEPKN